MCSPSTEQFSTITDFYAAAKRVVIDSTFSFEVSRPFDRGFIVDDVGRKESL